MGHLVVLLLLVKFILLRSETAQALLKVTDPLNSANLLLYWLQL